MSATTTDSVPTVRTGSVSSTGLTHAETRIVWLLLAAAFVAILNETTMSVAIPHLIDDLSITAIAAQWLTTAFMLTMAVVIPITGFLLQRYTTRQVFITAMSLFSLGTLTAFLSPGFEMLVFARVVQASGTAIMMPLLITTIMTVVPAHLRGRMMGRVSVVISLAPAIGPSVSGLLLDTVGWRWVFGLVLPIALLSLAAGTRWMTNLGETRRVRIDILSVVLSALGFGGLVFGLSQIGEGSSTDPAANSLSSVTLIASFAVGIVSLALFVWRQLRLQRRDAALLDLRVFRSANFSFAIVQMLIVAMAFFGALTVLPLYLQRVAGLTALESGLVLLPGALAMGLLGPVIGRIYDRFGTRTLLIPGAIISSGTLWFYATLDEATPVPVIIAAHTLFSIGLALSFTPLFTASLSSLEPRLYSYGSAVLSTIQQVAGAAGIALLVTVLSAVAASAATGGAGDIAAEAAGVRAAFLTGAILSTPAVVLAFLIRKPTDSIDTPIAR